MGHESRIELWSPHWTTFCFVGFGTDRLRRQEAMKTADRENPNRRVAGPCNRAHGAAGQNRSRSIKWAEKQEKFQPKEMCFFLHSPFIELIGTYELIGNQHVSVEEIQVGFLVGFAGFVATAFFFFLASANFCSASRLSIDQLLR
jgi:hypothetical protein